MTLARGPPRRARAHRRPTPRPAPHLLQGVVPARARAVEPGPGLRARLRVVGRRRRTCPPGAQRALRQPAHRGQPPLLLPHHRADVRRGLRVGRLGPPLDRRGGSPLDRDPRLPHRHPRSIPVQLERARMEQVECGEVPEPETAARRHRLRHPPGAGHPHRPPQHRQAARRQGRLRGHEAGGQRREPPPPLLPRPRHARPSRSTRRAWSCAIERQVRTFEMPGTGILDFEAHAKAIAKAGDLRLRHPPRPDPRAGRAAPLGHRAARGPRRRGRAGPGGARKRIGRIGKAGRRFAARRDEQLARS